jgi:hypothetical protein
VSLLDKAKEWREYSADPRMELDCHEVIKELEARDKWISDLENKVLIYQKYITAESLLMVKYHLEATGSND